MSITILRGRKQIATVFETIEEALAVLQKNDTLVLVDEDLIDPIRIGVRNVTLIVDGPPVDVVVSDGVSRLYLGEETRATVRTEGPNTAVYGGSADNTFLGAGEADSFKGGSGNETLFGGDGDDRLEGGAGDDFIVAGDGQDWAKGGDGNDVIVADAGMNRIEGGAGADVIEVHLDAGQNTIIFDFAPGEDRLEILGFGALESFDDVRAAGGEIYENSKGDSQIRLGDAKVELRGVSLAQLEAAQVSFVESGRVQPSGPVAPPPDEPVEEPPVEDPPVEEPPVEEPQPEDPPVVVPPSDDGVPLASFMVGDVEYKLRDGEPPHENFKVQDADGRWYSPDYFVLVAGGQSNMVGSSKTGDYIMNNDVMAYDWFNDAVIPGDYGAFPATLFEGASARNNLYFPMAVELTEQLDRPVLVVNRAYSGSRIDTWLESQIGTNWANLNDSVVKALAHVGQAKADAFIWHQGESDYPVRTEIFVDLLEELISQVRASDWAAADLDILMGELSREGTNFAQNAALQILEVANEDPDLRFVSSVGLSSDDRDGVHFNGPSLEAFGLRFAQALLDLREGVPIEANTAPTPVAGGKLGTVTVDEGQELRIDVSEYFTDADGDDLFYYSYLNRRSEVMTFEDQTTNEIVLRPDYTSAGDYRVFVYATDGALDGEKISFDLTVNDALPLVTSYSGRDFDRELLSYRDFDTAQTDMTRNKALDILDNGPGVLQDFTVSVDSLHIRGGIDIEGDFLLDAEVERVTLYGEAEFAVRGNALNNRITGNDGNNELYGAAGDDFIFGGGGDDYLSGNDGSNRLYGGDGDDVLISASGNSRLNGGAGADRFQFANGDHQLTIEDYDAQDVIVVSYFNQVTDYDAFLRTASNVFESNGRVIIDLYQARLVINDMTLDELSEDVFAFV